MKRSYLSFFLYCIPVIILLVVFQGCESCQQDFDRIDEICHTTPSSEHLLSVRSVDFEAIGSKYLIGIHQTVYVCSDHFPLGSTARYEFGLAAYEVNRVEGSDLLYNSVDVGHKTKSDLFPSSAIGNYFEYVDNDLTSDSYIHPCKSGGSITGWAMNVCRHNGSEWKGAAPIAHWVVSVNAHNYIHYGDPTSDDHPYKHGILHELAHTWGMSHAENWDSDDYAYISTMQGKLIYLSALDVAYLRYRYPSVTCDPHSNYVAGSKTRFDKDKGTFEKMVFSEDNPQNLFIDSDGHLKDCRTDDSPYFYVSWFNTGNVDGNPDVCGVNRLFLRSTTTDQTIELYTWRIAAMPYLSQDQWQGSVDPSPDDVALIDLSLSYELVFMVNAWGTLDELTDYDNELTYPVNIFGSRSCM